MLALACIALGACLCKADILTYPPIKSVRPDDAAWYGEVTWGDLICLGGTVMVVTQAFLKKNEGDQLSPRVRADPPVRADLCDLLLEIGVPGPQVDSAKWHIEELLKSSGQEPTLGGLVLGTRGKHFRGTLLEEWPGAGISLLMDKLERLAAGEWIPRLDRLDKHFNVRMTCPSPADPVLCKASEVKASRGRPGSEHHATWEILRAGLATHPQVPKKLREGFLQHYRDILRQHTGRDFLMDHSVDFLTPLTEHDPDFLTPGLLMCGVMRSDGDVDSVVFYL